jgi:superfamily II RNA helicase
VITSSLDPASLFGFALDSFQQDAIAALDSGASVVVCAPTGSGKTLIGEYAIYRALFHNKRVFYTTPLKALSNQKLRDFRDRFGAQQVGLLTGDTSINRDAPILVMTTEIFRNMLYGTPIGQVGISMVDLEAVVLDECHYMNDSQRGTVWEESIIYCPAEVQLVALSATVANSDQLTDWINQVHGPTVLINSDFRPVPLEYFFANPKGLFPLLDQSGAHMNPRLKPKGGTHRPRGANRRGMPKPEVPSLPFIVDKLCQYDMLPAIYFIFSRRGCNQALTHLGDMCLVEGDRAKILNHHIDVFVQQHPEAVRSEFVEPLRRGLAAHHAGILPAWKVLIEELFQQGLIPVVFATETLAAGINMPARTTVISTLSKRTDVGHRLLTPSEFLQMSGRAGRRGMDEKGYVVTVQTPFEGARDAAHLATVGADPLVSQFTPTYGMVLNLLQVHMLDEVKMLIERSFGQYLATQLLRPQQVEIQRCQLERDSLQAQLAEVDWAQVAEYEKLQGRLKEERRLLKLLEHQAQESQVGYLATALSFAVAGTLVILKGEHVKSDGPLPAVLVLKTQGAGQFPYLVCLGQNNRWYVATVADVQELRGEFPRIAAVDHLQPPLELLPKPGQSRKGDQDSAMVAACIPAIPDRAEEWAPEVQTQGQQVERIQQQLEEHPVHRWGHLSHLHRRRRRLESLEAELENRTEKLTQQFQRHWEDFLSLIQILQEMGALDNLKPTQLGEAAAAIRGENELWLGLAVMSGHLDGLDPHHLAAVCAALVMEVSRPDSWTSYGVSEAVLQALEELRPARRQLLQQQRRRDIVLPVWFEQDLIGLVEQWALGVDWLELCGHTSLDEGDVVRILRRTLDFLSQIPHVPHGTAELQRNAVRAMQLIDRFPVNEMLE